MTIDGNSDLQRRKARAVGKKFFEICVKADPSIKMGIDLIRNQQECEIPERKKMATLLRMAWEEGVVAVGQQLLDAADAEVA